MAKQAPPASGDPIPSRRRIKRPRKFDNFPLSRSSARIRSLDDPEHLRSAAQIQSHGAKRERSNQLRSCCTSKRARAASVAPTALSSSSLRRHKWWRDWSNLEDGPAGLIAERVLADGVASYVRFRAVCTAWRQCAADPRKQSSLDSRFHPRPWLMLREEDLQPAAPHRRQFMNFATGQCVQMDLPEIQGHCAFGPTTEGLLVLVDECTLVVRLLNPFTRQLTEFPSLATLLPRNRFKKCLFSKKRVKTCYAHDLADGDLSVGGAGLAGEGMVALYFSESRMLAVARACGERWMLVHRGTWFMSMLSFAGRFYCASGSSVMTVEASGNQPPHLVEAAQLARPYSPMVDTLHLVENGKELMLVHHSLFSNKYEAHLVDLDARKARPICGLNGQAVFIGKFRAFSVDPKVFPSISADTIYPGFELGEDKIDAYHLSDRSTEPSTSSYDVSGGLILARPFRIIDVLSLYIGGYRDEYA